MKKIIATVLISAIFNLHAVSKEEISSLINPTFNEKHYGEKQKIEYRELKKQAQLTIKKNLKTIASSQKITSLQAIKISDDVQIHSKKLLGKNLSQTKNFHELEGRLETRKENLKDECLKNKKSDKESLAAAGFDLSYILLYVQSKEHNQLINDCKNKKISSKTLKEKLNKTEESFASLINAPEFKIWNTKGKVIHGFDFKDYPVLKKVLFAVGGAAISAATATLYILFNKIPNDILEKACDKVIKQTVENITKKAVKKEVGLIFNKVLANSLKPKKE